MMFRRILIAIALVTNCAAASAADGDLDAVLAKTIAPDATSQATTPISDAIVAPVLRASVTVSGDVVRIGDLIDNAGPAARIAVYRSPDLGTTGSLPTAQVLATLRNYQVIGVDTHDIHFVSVTRLARTLSQNDVGQRVAQTLEHRNGLGDAGNITITFDRELRTLQLDPANSGDMQPASVYYDPRSGRFDVMFEIANANNGTPMRLRFTGTAVETVEAAVLTHGIERGEVLKSSDVVVERRSKAEVGNDAARRDQMLGMQARKAMRAGDVLHTQDVAKPDLVQHDQIVTLIYQSDNLYLTSRGKAVDSGSEGDSVTVMNLQSKRTIQGVVTGPGQVSITVAKPLAVTTAALSDR